MTEKKKFQKKYVDSRIKIIHRVFLGLMIYMFGVVLYDSFVHELPFNYILFWFAGLIIGRLFSRTQVVGKKKNLNKITMQIKPAGIVLTALLIVVRIYAGVIILNEFNMVWAADALYLVFIGIYYSRLKNIVKQIDDRVYAYISAGEIKPE